MRKELGRAVNWSLSTVMMLTVGAFLAHPEAALATNGMNMEGYGPVASGMGGGSLAYDNGTAAMMNNPATMGMMAPGNRLDIALGYLGPDITTKIPGMPSEYDAQSTADSFFMPAIGWAKRRGNLTYGVGMYAQGGMGTEYDSQSFMSGYSSMNDLNMGSTGLPVRSEVSVGRLILPLVAEASSRFYVGGSLDFVWAGMDLQMVMGGSQMQDMMASFGGTEEFGTLSGTMLSTLSSMIGAGPGMLDADSPVNWGYFNFSNGTPYSGKAQGAGLGGKIGLAYKASKELTIGATYHSTTSLGDLTTEEAELHFNVNLDDGVGGTATGPAMTAVAQGKMMVRDFEWPQQLAVGAAYHPNNTVMIVADLKWINWREVMRDFHMTFEATSDSMGGAFTGTVLDATLYQRWKNQLIYILGAAYRATDMLTLRVGMNRSSNPIPDQYANPLFPAIIKSHYTLGAGLAFSRQFSTDLSVSYAPEVKTLIGQGLTTSHSQTNAQVMASFRF